MGGGPVFSAWVAGKRSLFLEQESAEAEERAYADLARKTKGRELEAWEQSKVCPPAKMGLSGNGGHALGVDLERSR